MNKKFYILICLCISFAIKNSTAQCTWQTVLSDGFEYQTACPDLIPGMTVHTVPQSFAVVSGSYSLYMNFVNCTGTSGACAGDTIYKRHFQVCSNMQYKFSAYLTTSFSGVQCNMRVVITDGNGTVLNLQPNVVCNYFPTLTAYNSGAVTTTSSDMYFILITNVGGSAGGNDLSMDEFLLEQCFPTSTVTSATANICSNLTQKDLFSYLAAGSDTTGNWSGPGSLTNGYFGTFTVATSIPGTYAYTSPYYGTVVGCPMKTDSVAAAVVNCTSINELDNNGSISILPNPVQDFIILNSKNIKIEKVEIIDQSGRTVKIFNKENAGKIYVGDLPNAIYNIKIISEKHSWVRKFSKM